MSSSARRIVIEFLGEDKSASKVARQVDGSTSKMGEGLKKVGKTAALGLAAAGVAVVAFGKSAIAEARESQKVGAQTEAVIKSTGGAANVTAKQVGDLATSISNKTGIDDEAIQTGENMLLTFKNIRDEAGKGNDVFDQTTQVVTDMSVAMGTDMKSASILVGKALNDPIKGLSALSRVGVTFTDQQKKQIETMVAAGDTMGAQKVVLKELNSEFGGSAEAQATAGEKMSTTWANFQEQIGTMLLPVLDKFETFIAKKILPAVASFAVTVQTKVIPAVKEFIREIGPSVRKIAALVVAKFREMAAYIRANMDNIKATIHTAVDIIRVLWARFGQNIVNIIRGNLKMVVGVLKGAFLVIRGIFKVVHALLTGDWRELWSGLKDIARGALIATVAIIRGLLNTAKEVVRAAFGIIKDIVRSAWSGIKDLAASGVSKVVDIVRGLPGKIGNVAGSMLRAGASLIHALFDGIRGAAGDFGGFVSGLASSLVSAVKSAINSALDLPLTVSIDKGPIHLHATVIPAFAKGVRNFGGGVALVGERGPELVDLPRGSSVIPNNVAFPGGDQTVGRLVVEIRQDGSVIEEKLVKLKRTRGGSRLAFEAV